MHTIEKKKRDYFRLLRKWLWSIVMQTPTVIVTQPLDLMKTISREQLSNSRDMGFVNSFRLESVLELTKKRTTAN